MNSRLTKRERRLFLETSEIGMASIASLFVDPEKRDYHLEPDSPALKRGFKPIPIEEIGPYQSDLRASWPIVEAPGASKLGDFTTVRYYEVPE